MNFFNFSQTSDEPFYKSQKNNQTGGFLDFTNYSKLLFDALSQKNYAALNFLVNSSEIKKLSNTDNHGQTILHLLVQNYKEDPQVASVVKNILSRSDVSKFINIQDKNGNTALHLAVIAGLDNLCDDLVRAGANKSLKNNFGQSIDSETETESRIPEIVKSPVSDNSTKSVFISKKELENQSIKKEDTQFVNNVISNLTNAKLSTDTSEARGFTEFNVTGSVMPSAQTKERNNNYSEYSNLINTSEFIDDLVSKYNNPKQSGGKIMTRKLNTNSHLRSEFGMSMNKTSSVNIVSSSTDEESEKSQSSGMSELSRMINNQATEIHERTIKKIMELMKINEQEARTIKAYIYNEVKNQHPELNNFDRAVEMEKRVTKEYLEKLDSSKLKELSEIISTKQKEKEEALKSSEKLEVKEEAKVEKKETKTKKEPKEKKETKTKKSTKSKKESSLTSSVYDEDEDEFSETSLDSLS